VSALVILNPHAGGGRAGRLWHRIEPLLWEVLGDPVIAITQRPAEVAAHLDDAMRLGFDRVITIGGDGTNHVIINALAALAEQGTAMPLPVLGILPIGTGRDWARALGIPLKPEQAVQWLAEAQPQPVDVGRLACEGSTTHFLNIASSGISGEIAANVNAIQHRRPWTFFSQTVQALLHYQPRPMRVLLDGELWYEGRSFVVVVANGRYFGHGMLVAPEASIDDGLFDVVLVEGMHRLAALQALPTIYNGTHLLRDDVHHARAADVRIESATGPLDLELDGEYDRCNTLRFSVVSGLVQMLRR